MTPQEQYWKQRCEAAENFILNTQIIEAVKVNGNDGERRRLDKWNVLYHTEPPAPVCHPKTHNFHIARHGKCQDCGGAEWMDAPAPAQGVEEAAKEFSYEHCKPAHRQDKEVYRAAHAGFTAGSRWQQGQQGSNEDWQRQYSDLLEWTVMLIGPLKELVELKQMKDEKGKTAEYEERQPKAWYMARTAVAMWEERGNYGLKLKHVIPQPPTIGARWVSGTPKLTAPCVFVSKTSSKTGYDYAVWEAMYIDNGDGSYLAICNGNGEEWGDIADFHCDAYYMLSANTFPTREQAEQWAKSDSKHVWFEEECLAALAMYDWIAEKIKIGQ